MARHLPGILVTDSLSQCHPRKKLPDPRRGHPAKRPARALQAAGQARTGDSLGSEEPKKTRPQNAAWPLGGVLGHMGHYWETGEFKRDLTLS